MSELNSEDKWTRYERQIEEIEDVIREYYTALDNHQHGGKAQRKAFSEIEKILGMRWGGGSH